MSKNRFVKIRLSNEDYEKASEWANSYGDDMSTFFRRMLRSLPDKPPVIPQPPVKP